MATRASSWLLEWGTSALVTALFVVLWWRQRAVSPATHEEASSLLHAQLGVGGLWTATAHADRSWFAYWLCLVPMGSGPDALTVARTFSLVCAAVMVFALAATAGRLWGTGGALVAGGFLVANPAIVTLALSARGEMLGLALLALASWLLVALLESYQDLGLGPGIVYGLLLAAMVVCDLTLAPVMVAHLFYAATMRPSGEGWRQLVPGWLAGAAIAVLIWANGHAGYTVAPGPQDGSGQLRAVVRLLLDASGDFPGQVMLGGAALIIIIAIVNTHGNAFFDTGLGLAVLMVVAQPGADLLLALTGRATPPDQVLGATTLGAALLLGCAAGQWRGANMQSLVVLLLAAGLGIFGWRSYSQVKPSWRNADGNPPLARDLMLTTAPGDVVAVDEKSGPGLTGAIALAMGDQRLWQEARDQLTAASPRVFLVAGHEPWASAPASTAQAGGNLTGAGLTGSVRWVSLDASSAPDWQHCTIKDSDPYARATVTHLECAAS
ncbi:glycosyltransferase family 39 protein [Propionibacterium freudenreichii]|uniref:glycosyltransferase family 39 protein n=1 Tax=Propionibacterium freudenreichii TaxID=1744 RepID=UPI000541C573|nr:glycosyltransferase family 39 protein [Propionibacterium freudenreichii]CEG92608.1 Hypothetical protein PFCIRM122_06795 [Propionibacterium freudenreichii]